MAILNYNHLRYFWAVAHNGNLTRTADQLNVSQSALSLQIKKLEDRLGHALFDRKGKQLVLTEAGKIALDHADAIFSTGDELVSTLNEQSDGTLRVLRVGALSTLSRNFQAQFLKPLMTDDTAGVTIRTAGLRTLIEDLNAHNLDVVLTNQAPVRTADEDWIVHKLAEQRVSLVGCPRRLKPGKNLAETISKHVVITPSVDNAMRVGFDALCEKLGVRPKIVAEVDDMALLRVLARDGAGLAVVPPIVVIDELESGALDEVTTLPSVAEHFYAVTTRRRFPNPLLKVVFDAAADFDGADDHHLDRPNANNVASAAP
ncbi:MAG: LysR family transcriptional regulator [Pseudomonadota bacterium]